MTPTVVKLNHPIVTIKGIKEAFIDEIITFKSGAIGQIISFEDDSAKVMVFTNQPIKIGMKAKQSGQRIHIDIFKDTLGKIVNPLGESLHGYIDKSKPVKKIIIDVAPPHLSYRRRIDKQLVSGVSVVDLLLPLGRGQRELIIGDKKTGKTSFLRKLLKTQAEQGTIIIYASIAKRMSKVMDLYRYLKANNILDQTVMVTTVPQDPASLISLTPFAAITLAEYYNDQGKDVLVIFDNLSNHAQFHREIGLLNKQFPGRDSYPGDVFYTHARLLERAGNFVHPHDNNQQVSITCLPVAETTDNDLTDYIVSNLISITDGHLLFDNRLVQKGRWPAINTFLSVTRVGKQTQTPLQRQINQTITSFLSKYERTVSLTHFGSDLSKESQEVVRLGDSIISFFEEDIDTQTPVSVQQLITSLLWNKLLIERDKKTIQQLRNCLVEKYFSDLKFKKEVDELIANAKSFQDLCKTTKKDSKKYILVCHNSKQ